MEQVHNNEDALDVFPDSFVLKVNPQEMYYIDGKAYTHKEVTQMFLQAGPSPLTLVQQLNLVLAKDKEEFETKLKQYIKT